jgi:hypothetical protein
MITPAQVWPTSTQFFVGVQALDLTQIRLELMSRTSAAMAVPPKDARTLGIILPTEYSREQQVHRIDGRYVTFIGQIMDKILNVNASELIKNCRRFAGNQNSPAGRIILMEYSPATGGGLSVWLGLFQL